MKKKTIKRLNRALRSISETGKTRSKKLLEDIFTAAVTSAEYETWNAHQRAEAMRLFSNINQVLS